jgi:hypothetical protein
MSPMSEYRGLFDAAISQRDRKQRDKWRILAKPDGMFAGIFQYSNHLLRGPQSEDDIPLPFIVADYSSGPCHGQFRSQSLSKVANQPWFLPENQGDPSMQIPSVRIDICMIHKCPISWLLCFHISIVQSMLRVYGSLGHKLADGNATLLAACSIPLI